jgi:hypothetical protein
MLNMYSLFAPFTVCHVWLITGVANMKRNKMLKRDTLKPTGAELK